MRLEAKMNETFNERYISFHLLSTLSLPIVNRQTGYRSPIPMPMPMASNAVELSSLETETSP